MGKAPAFQFYVNDWLGDVELQAASSSTRGIWINALCRMWHSRIRGEIKGYQETMSRILNCQNGEFEQFEKEAKALGFCYISRDPNGIITLRNRRMYGEQKERENNRLRQKRYYEKKKTNGQSNGNLTPPSSSSSSSSKPIDTPNGVSSPEASGNGPDPPKIPQCPQGEIKALYHEILCPPLAPVNEWSPELAKILRNMWREKPERWELTWWEKYFHFVKASDFLMGRKTDFIADLEWIIRPRNRTKILNGRFHNRGSPELKKFAGILEWLRVQEEKT